MAGLAENPFCTTWLESTTSSPVACISLALLALGSAALALRPTSSSEPGSWRRLLGSLSWSDVHELQQQQPSAALARPVPRSCSAASLDAAARWVAAIEGQEGVEQVITAEMLLDEKLSILEDDHMFSALVAQGLLEDLAGYYAQEQRKFYAVVRLGRAVCGFPRIVHGGLTAAIMDESLGMLMFALKKSGALPPGPMFTAQLNVTYQRKIDSCSAVLCTCEVESQEGRKLWMKATVSDGLEGDVYATARALFVAPKPKN